MLWLIVSYIACRSWAVFCLLLGVSSDYAQPTTGEITEVTCSMIGWAQPELTPSKRQKTGPGWKARSCCNIGYLTPKFMLNINLVKSRPYITSMSVVESLCKFGHDSNTAVIWASKNESITQQQVMDRWNFARFEFNMIFGGISYIAPNAAYH